MMEFVLRPIGLIHSPFTEKDLTPIQVTRSQALGRDDQEHGISATRYPYRPNPIGLSTVRLISRQENMLAIAGVDVLDSTPLLDIKPYIRMLHLMDRVFCCHSQHGYRNRRAP